MSSTLELNIVTPEKSIVKALQVDAIVMPGDAGQLTILPGHINFLTSLKTGTFGYKVAGTEWQIAFLSGGFAQVLNGKTTILAETMEMSHELSAAEAELEIQELLVKMKTLKPGSTEYSALSAQKSLAAAKLKAAQNKLH